MKARRAESLVFPKRMYLFIIPALVMFLLFWIMPLVKLFGYCMTDYDGLNPQYNFVGWSNFVQLFKDNVFSNTIGNTLRYTLIMVIGNNIIGLLLAVCLNMKMRYKSFFRTCAFLPTLFSALVVGYIWTYVYMPGGGMLASVLSTFGIDVSTFSILGNFNTALYGIAVVDIWKNVGTTMIIYLAGLQTVDEALLEAGRIDGCNEWQVFRKVKLPLISPTITINIVLNIIAGLKAFDYPYIMTNGGPGHSTQTLMFSVFRMGNTEMQYGKASALSVVSFGVIILITIVMLYIMNKREVEL